MKRGFILFLLIFLLGSGVARADAGTKFGRGLSNTAFGWFEIVNEIGNESDRHGAWIGGPSGFIRGMAFGTVRTLAGIYELVTFPFPNGRKGYGPIVLPESVFNRGKGRLR